MNFTVRTTDDDELAIENAKRYVKSTKKGGILLECTRLVPELKNEISDLKSQIYKLESENREFENFKSMLKKLVK